MKTRPALNPRPGDIRKAIAYAYATSPHAVELGHAKTGCYYVSQSILREDGTWSPPYIAQGHDAFADRNDPDLILLFTETDGEPCPHWLAAEVRRKGE
jgi:hypothetical protein